jgi:hypothetical protein
LESQSHLLQSGLTSHKVATWRREVRINIDQTPSRQEAEREQEESRGSRKKQKRAGREQERAEREQRESRERAERKQRESREILAGEQSGGRRQAPDHVGDLRCQRHSNVQ